MYHPLDSLLAFVAGVIVATTVQLLPDTINPTIIAAFIGVGGAIGTAVDLWQRNPRPTYMRTGGVAGLIVGVLVFVGFALFGA
jgi:uncharacterized membrane protein YjjP (DUF1212 family)